MRELTKYPHRYTKVIAMDEKQAPGMGNHKYQIFTEDETFAELSFQNGPIKEYGANGVMDENLIAIVIDRLEGFQSGPYACRENAIALTHLENALLWLNHRTAQREARGVEGTHAV
jgi:hypothetical protein